MKGTRVRAVEMVRRIRDRQARALAGKSAAEIIAFYQAAGVAATQDAAPSRSRSTQAPKALKSTTRDPRAAKTRPASRVARG
jgi:hypothetical protein